MNISYEVVSIGAFLVSLLAVVLVYAKNTHLKAQIAEQEKIILSIRSDLSAICTGALGLGEHLAELEQQASQLNIRQEKIEMQSPASQNYQYARNMIGKGANLDEVIADCGLARGEAELVVLAQKIKQAS